MTCSQACTFGPKHAAQDGGVVLRSALALRALSPPLALMTAQETALAGAFRSAHQARSLPAC